MPYMPMMGQPGFQAGREGGMMTPGQGAPPNMALANLLNQFKPGQMTKDMRMQSRQAQVAQDPYQAMVAKARQGMGPSQGTGGTMMAGGGGSTSQGVSPLLLAMQRMRMSPGFNMGGQMMPQGGSGGMMSR